MQIETLILEMGQKAKQASQQICSTFPEKRNAVLLRIAALLLQNKKDLLAANAIDVKNAKDKNMDSARIDRLCLTDAIIEDMMRACKEVANQSDPVGALETQWQRPNGILVGRMRVPLGVVAMIFESRPNVTIEAAILCIKSANAVILRGGSEALHSNLALAALVAQALKEEALPETIVQVVPVTDREAVALLAKLDAYIDVIIPRGGESLVRAVTEIATVPVLKHFQGVCHAYVDTTADIDETVAILENSKMQRPAACNALECLLVHKDIAATLLPAFVRKIQAGTQKLEIRACAQSFALLKDLTDTVVPAVADDYGQEFHDYIVAVKIVENYEEAVAHIQQYGSHHSEIICTTMHAQAMNFVSRIDASMVAVNVSTRFNDGGQLGLGAEIGISTSKIHAYGPMGVRELTTTKFVVFGSGQIRA